LRGGWGVVSIAVVHRTSLLARRRLASVALALIALATAGTIGAAGAPSSRASGSILRVGTTYYIDSLNPFVAFDAQAVNAFTMLFPQLVQYGPGLKLQGDWASSWSHSSDGLVWTFHLRSGGKWSDGVPLTADDAVWTISTELKYSSGATSYLASELTGVKSASAPNATTLVITYSHPVAATLANLEQFFVLPKHIWASHVGTKGSGLKAFFPEKQLPVVSGGPYVISKYAAKGTTVYKPNPYFYGPKSNAAAVTLTYYTNPTSMIADFEAGNLDFIDNVPYTDANTLKGHSGVTLDDVPGSEVTNLGFNSNPAKPKNRELLDPKLKQAFEFAIPRKQIVDVVFGGHAQPWANIMSAFSVPSGWVNPAVKPLPYDPAKAKTILDGLGYKASSGGVRQVPATTGKYAQPAHAMSYNVIVPNDLDFNGDRQFAILAAAFAKIGVQLHEVAGGDVGQAYTDVTAPKGTYKSADMYTWYWHPYVDPKFNLSVVTKAQWNNNSDTGYNDPKYDAWYNQQQTMVDQKKRQALVWKMEAYLAKQRPYIQLVDTNLLTANSSRWTGFYPDLWSYCKCYYTSPHPS
jgi:peptide/nickel transport system substrate-binding protein